MRAACIQMEHPASLDEGLLAVERLVRRAKRDAAALALLPEYWFASTNPDAPGLGRLGVQQAGEMLAHLSREHAIALAGNLIVEEDGRLRNVVFAWQDGKLVGRQAKAHPMPREAEKGIVGDPRLATFAFAGMTTGGIVCADVFYPEVPRILSLQGARLLLNPVMS